MRTQRGCSGILAAAALALMPVIALGATGSTMIPNVLIKVQGDAGPPLMALGSGPALPALDGPLPLVYETSPPLQNYGCDLKDQVRLDGKVQLVDRGGGALCTFTRKAENAQRRGAAALIVANTVPAMFANETTGLLKDGCYLACEDGMAETREACETTPTCGSQRCVRAEPWTPEKAPEPARPASTKAWCCLLDEYEPMYVNATTVSIPVVFATIAERERLVGLAEHRRLVSMVPRPPPPFDASALCIWVLGVATVALASFRAAARERAAALRGGAESADARLRGLDEDDGREEAPELEQTVLTAYHVPAFLCSATVGLGALFLLLRAGQNWITFVTIAFFGLASASSLGFLVFEPLVDWSWPRAERISVCATAPRGRRTAVDAALARLGFADPTAEEGDVLCTARDAASMALSFGLVAAWFLGRHSAWAWALQDAFAVAVCCVFLLVIRLPSLRVAAALLSVFFCYDIFMVFVSPSIFGESVMVEVATGGSGGQDSAVAVAGTNECVRRAGERMPMLFMWPRFGYAGGYSMLGMGDVLFPGMLVCYALCFDYRRHGGPLPPRHPLNLACGFVWCCVGPCAWGLCGGRRPGDARRGEGRPRLSRTAMGEGSRAASVPHVGYWPWMVAWYGVGLAMAFAANFMELTFNGVKGQPALLYLVPCTLIPMICMSRARGEWREVWEGLDADQKEEQNPRSALDFAPTQTDEESGARGGRGAATAVAAEAQPVGRGEREARRHGGPCELRGRSGEAGARKRSPSAEDYRPPPESADAALELSAGLS